MQRNSGSSVAPSPPLPPPLSFPLSLSLTHVELKQQVRALFRELFCSYIQLRSVHQQMADDRNGEMCEDSREAPVKGPFLFVGAITAAV